MTNPLRNRYKNNNSDAYLFYPIKKSAIRPAAILCLVVLCLVVLLRMASCGEQDETALVQVEVEGETGADVEEEATEEETVGYSANVTELLQLPELPSGCEPTSLTIILNAMGYSIDNVQLVEDYMTFDSTWTDADSFLGSPYSGGGAFPPAMVLVANSFLESNGAQPTASDITGTSLDEILELANSGIPIMVWTTMYMQEPNFSGQTIEGYAWYRNEHCVVVYGTDENGDVLVSDPLDGLVVRDRDQFEEIYNTCGQMAVRVS